jgi:pyruvate kinase
MINRRTKILATLGPATDKPGVLVGILDAGVNVVRINFSHDSEAKHLARVAAVRKYAKEKNTYIGVLMDLQGPKIRISAFKNNKVELKNGNKFTLDANLDKNEGDQNSVGIAYKSLPGDVKAGDVLVLDDGKIFLEVERTAGSKIVTTVIQGGILYNGKGINLRGGGLSAHALTDKDRQDILIAAKADADYVALSFPVNADDVRETKKLLKEAGSNASVISKIERAESLADEVIQEILNESTGIMVARGDLGIEIGDPQLPAVQKKLIKLARSSDKVVITATQMLESMIANPIATRAEVFDVANAVLDGTDTVMLSAETAVGEYPVNAVKTMSDVCLEAEKSRRASLSRHRLHSNFEEIDYSIAMSAMYAANHIGAKVVAALTETGNTALVMSRISSNISIYAMSDSEKTLQKVTLYRGVYPCGVEKTSADDWYAINSHVVENLQNESAVEDGDVVIITKGMHKDKSGGTNMIKIVRVGEGNY